MEIEKLKSVRNGNKSVITKLFKKFDESKENYGNTDFDPEQVNSVFEKIVKKQSFVESISEEILALTEPNDVEQELLDSEDYSLSLDTKVRHARKFVQQIQNPQSSLNEDSPLSSHRLNAECPPYVPCSTTYTQPLNRPFENAHATASHMINLQPSVLSTASNQSHHLPKLALPTFSGNILEWQTFWDSYESAVHENPVLTNVQKFNYLKAQL